VPRRRKRPLRPLPPHMEVGVGRLLPGGGQGSTPVRGFAGLPHGSVVIYCGEPEVTVAAMLGPAGAQPVGGGPRHDIVERVGDVSVPRYEGHDPLRMDLAIVLDNWPRGRHVEARLRDLRRLGERNDDWTMPQVRLAGPVDYEGRVWERDGPLEVGADPPPIRGEGGWMRLPLTVPLIEHVEDRTLQLSQIKTRRQGQGPKFVTVRGGEDDFGDVSKRLYHTRSRAAELARANQRPVGARLKVGERLRRA
jgi:hypothetical protein